MTNRNRAMTKRKRRRHGDFHEFILLALLRKGPLNLDDIQKLTSIMITQFELVGVEFSTRVFSRLFRMGVPAAVRSSEPKQRVDDADVNVEKECESLLEEGLVELNAASEYTLTPEGTRKAEQFSEALGRGSKFFEDQLLGRTAAARNTTLASFILAVIKLGAGVIGGSVGLVSDGVDASIDTASALVSWVGMKIKRESLGVVVTILMMFIAGATVGYESVSRLWEAFKSEISPISMPYLVVGVESLALISAATLYLYQRYTGKRNGSLALISQSVDSKNHVYVALMVIAGAVLSVFGVNHVDSLVGIFVAGRITIDASGLLREVLSSRAGEAVDLSKYGVPLEREWQLSKLETFRSWILYSIKEEGVKTKEQVISSLERTFKPEYVPIIYEFRFNLGNDYDFHGSWESLVEPLISEGLLASGNEGYIITDKGKDRIGRLVKNIRYSALV